MDKTLTHQREQIAQLENKMKSIDKLTEKTTYTDPVKAVQDEML
jgi:hypothetical protein